MGTFQNQMDFLDLALDAGKIGIFEVDLLADPQGPRIVWNVHHEQMFGLAPGEFDGRSETFRSFLHPEDVDRFTKVVKDAIDDRKPYEITVRIICPDGSLKYITAYGRAVYDDGNTPTHLLGVCLDTTRSNRIRNMLSASLTQLQRENSQKSEFLARVSHEFRTPLSAIAGFLEILKLQSPSLFEQESLPIIARNTQHLLELVDDVLDITQIESGNLHIARAPYCCEQLLRDAIDAVLPAATKKNLDISLNVATTVPAQIETDATKFHRVLLNLLSNAVKYTDSGKISVTTSYDSKGNILNVFVIDTGIGIPRKDWENVFDPFYRGKGETVLKQTGTGLGLALSKLLANSLGGGLEISDSDIGMGTTFRFFLKLHDNVNSASALKSNGELPNGQLEGIKLLLAEDNPDSQTLFKLLLADSGSEVIVSANGEEAVEKALSNRPDLVLMDIEMPIKDGYEATAELREAGFERPIIALTAHGLQQVHEHCRLSGFTACIRKPIGRTKLIQQIRETLTSQQPAVHEL